MLKEYIESYVKQTANNSTKAEDKGTIPSQGVSNTTIPKGGSNSTLPTSTVTTEGNNTRSTLSLPANDSMINPSSNASNTNRTSLVSPSDMSSNGTNSTVNSITSNQTATTQTNQTNTNTTMTIEKSTVVNLTNTTHPSIDNATNATKLLQIAKENVLDNNIVMGTLIEKERKMRTLNLRKQTRSIIL